MSLGWHPIYHGDLVLCQLPKKRKSAEVACLIKEKKAY